MKRLLNKRTTPVRANQLRDITDSNTYNSVSYDGFRSLSTPPCLDVGTAPEIELQPSTQTVFAKANAVEELKEESFLVYICNGWYTYKISSTVGRHIVAQNS